jgi:hypothetical protein
MGSVLSLRSRNINTGDAQSEYDAATTETIQRYTAAILDEDFIGPAHVGAAGIPTAATVGYPWIQKTQKTAGVPSVAAVANAAGGVVRLLVDATSELQEATLYAADVLNWDVTKSLVWEARISNHVVPSVAGLEIVFGLQTAWINGPDTAAEYVRFQQLASGVVNIQAKDGVIAAQSVATGITMATDVFHIFRIDCTNPQNIRFFIDGVEMNTPGQITYAGVGAAAILQPYVSIYKASGAGTAQVDVDMIQAGQNRS